MLPNSRRTPKTQPKQDCWNIILSILVDWRPPGSYTMMLVIRVLIHIAHIAYSKALINKSFYSHFTHPIPSPRILECVCVHFNYLILFMAKGNEWNGQKCVCGVGGIASTAFILYLCYCARDLLQYCEFSAVRGVVHQQNIASKVWIEPSKRV